MRRRLMRFCSLRSLIACFLLYGFFSGCAQEIVEEKTFLSDVEFQTPHGLSLDSSGAGMEHPVFLFKEKVELSRSVDLSPTLYAMGLESVTGNFRLEDEAGFDFSSDFVETRAPISDVAAIASSYEIGFRPIINGQLDTSQERMGVVALYNTQGAMCSGTLVSSREVLTAAHCVHGFSTHTLNVIFGTDIQSHQSTWVSVSDVKIHPNYSGGSHYQAPVYDIAMVRLSQAAPAGISPIPYLPAAYALTSSDVGKPLTFVGFGTTGSGQNTRKYYFVGALGAVCDGPSQCSYGGAVVAPYCIAYSNQAGGPCSGDSGGPALFNYNGVDYVAGVTSYGDQYCEYYGVSTKVDKFQFFIEEFIGNTVPEICHNGIDDNGNGLTDCQDPECASSPFCSGPEACQESVPLACGDVSVGSTSGGSQRFTRYGCSADKYLGSEVAYKINAPVGTRVTVTLTPTTGVDMDLFALPASGDSCDTNRCLGVSAKPGGTQDSFVLTIDQDTYIVVDSKEETSGGYQLSLKCGDDNVEICDNGIDDTGNGLTDCEDPECADFWACQPADYEICNNGIDDTHNGLTDCEDPDCAQSVHCVGKGGGTEGGCDCRVASVPRRDRFGGVGIIFLLGLFGLIRIRRKRIRRRRN